MAGAAMGGGLVFAAAGMLGLPMPAMVGLAVLAASVILPIRPVLPEPAPVPVRVHPKQGSR